MGILATNTTNELKKSKFNWDYSINDVDCEFDKNTLILFNKFIIAVDNDFSDIEKDGFIKLVITTNTFKPIYLTLEGTEYINSDIEYYRECYMYNLKLIPIDATSIDNTIDLFIKNISKLYGNQITQNTIIIDDIDTANNLIQNDCILTKIHSNNTYEFIHDFNCYNLLGGN